MNDTTIDLQINTANLDRFCEKLIKKSRNTSKAHDELITLEAFITQFSQHSQGSDEYKAIMSCIKKHSENTRQQLLAESAIKLDHALRNMSIHKITQIHLPLSRNGFYEILKQVSTQFTQLETSIIGQWASQWVSSAKQKAEAASGYPDALDFDRAKIKRDDYLAMKDVSHYLEGINDNYSFFSQNMACP